MSVISFQLAPFRSAEAKTAELETSLGIRAEFRYRNTFEGLAARLSAEQIDVLLWDPEIAAVRAEGSLFVIRYAPQMFGPEGEIETRLLEADLGLRSRYRYREWLFPGFAAELTAAQLATLDATTGLSRIREDPSQYFGIWRKPAPTPKEGEAFAKRLGLTLERTGPTRFDALLSARHIQLLSASSKVGFPYPIDSKKFLAFDTFEIFNSRLADPVRPRQASADERPALRAAFLTSNRVAPSAVRGPVCRVYVARFGKYEYALATFSGKGVSRVSQPERFGRRLGGVWLDLDPTRGIVCDRDVPFLVLRAWNLEQIGETKRVIGSCYRAAPTVRR